MIIKSRRRRVAPAGRVLLGVVTVAALIAGAPSAMASPAPVGFSGPPGPGTPTSSYEYGLIWKTADGRTMSVTKRDPADLPRLESTTATYCYLGAGNISYNGRFNWASYHSCSGSYGLVTHQSRLLRSSWSGYRGYTDWRSQGPTARIAWTYYWSDYCRGGGTYDYKAEVKIYASGIGYWSPSDRSNNSTRQACGT
jgi:hypothetical protein